MDDPSRSAPAPGAVPAPGPAAGADAAGFPEGIPRPGGWRGWTRSAVLAAFLLAAGLMAWAGCTPESRYRTLSYFFDGVPDPNAPASTRPGGGAYSGPGGARVVVYTHKPYADNQCPSCHVGAGTTFESFTRLESSICLKCHQDKPRQYPIMHGPVASVACLWCHNPHESTVPHLLVMPAPKVCLQCHANRRDLGPPVAEHLDPNRSCLDCHTAHGGVKHGLLKAGITLESFPATQPALAPTLPAWPPTSQPRPFGHDSILAPPTSRPTPAPPGGEASGYRPQVGVLVPNLEPGTWNLELLCDTRPPTPASRPSPERPEVRP
jgi:predicted CXXCH cytochrome family protein